MPNFLLERNPHTNTYSDVAPLSGLAVNMNGDATAAMGVAAGDVNGDQLVDLFVTNFETEANCLYLQQNGRFFQDAVVSAGLKSPGIPYVGWGTQFLDAANDGDLDLVVANGHVADFGDSEIQYRMPLQFFDGDRNGRFQQLPTTSLGPVFDAGLLGRSIATLDWNRDGRTDFLVSSIGTPTILAENTTDTKGHWLRVKLHATRTARDACGASVEVTTGGLTSWNQVSAGDGYQATNERMLHFGLDDCDVVESLTIRWPSGAETILTSVEADGTLICAEDCPTATWQSQSSIVSVPAMSVAASPR